MDFDILTNC